jgi:hypothetical protein
VADHHILEFEVTVHDATLAEGLQRLGDVFESLPLLGVRGEVVLREVMGTFLSNWKRFPQGRYSST